MRNLVVIKSNKYGVSIHLDPMAPYQVLVEELRVKFSNAARFFNGATMALTFEGRVLTKAQEREIIDVISSAAQIHITCIIDNNKRNERMYRNIVADSLEELDRQHDGQFYRGTLKKRQVLEAESSVIIIGDVDAGAIVISKGNVIVLGTIRGTVHAGAGGRQESFISALAIRSKRLKIGEKGKPQPIVLRKRGAPRTPKIAKTDGSNIYIDSLVN